jgi:HlyD family secretion protein
MKNGLLGLVLIMVASGVAIGLRPQLQSWKTPAPKLTPASSRSTRIFAVGIVEGRSSSVESRFETAGRVTQVHVEEGDRVQAGQPLATLDTEELICRRDLAQARLDQAKANLATAQYSRDEELSIAQARLDAKQTVLQREESNLQRLTTLLENLATSRQEFEDQVAAVDVLRAEVRSIEAELQLLRSPAKPSEIEALQAVIAAAQSELRLAELELRRGQLVAPADGVVLTVNVQVGEWVSLQSPVPTVVTVDDSELRIRAFVEEADALAIETGLPVSIRKRTDYNALPMAGTITRVGPQFDMKQVMNRRSDERFDVRTRECWISPTTQNDLILGAHVDILIELQPSGNPQS